jgi:hypothetical protein
MAEAARAGRCGICGALAPRGATLCVQCVAAVRRARHANALPPRSLPVSNKMPSAHGSALRSALGKAWWRHDVVLPALRRRWAMLLAFSLFAIAVCVTGYMAVEELAAEQRAGGHGDVLPASTSSAPPPRAAPSDASRPASAVESLPETHRRDPG